MLTLTIGNPQKRYLRTLAHARKPVVIVGDKGLSTAVMQEITQALDHHELIKIRVNAEDRQTRETMITELCTTTDAVLIQRVGHVATLFKRNADSPRIEFP